MLSETISIHAFIESFIKGLEARDLYTSGHSIRVAHLATEMAKMMNLTEAQIHRVHIAGHLHDIGKIGIPDCILNKKGKLSVREYNALKRHADIGANIVGGVEALKDISQIILYHHEWYDGSGYPKGIKKEAIPIESRIIAVSDAYDAMRSHRSYRSPLKLPTVIHELKKGRGSQFDPKVTDCLLKIISKEKEVLENLEGNEIFKRILSI